MKRISGEIRKKAIGLRKKGYSFAEISGELNISKSTCSLLMRNVVLDKKAAKRLNNRKFVGYKKIAQIWKDKKAKEAKKNKICAEQILQSIGKDVNHCKLYCALLYWCEGEKSEKGGVRFINSDPVLIKTFLNLFRNGFAPEEEKFRILMHLHDYHDEYAQKIFWSKLTKIPQSRFYKTFLKPHTGKRIKNNYPGCVAIYYNSRALAREIREIYKIFSQ